MPNTYLKPFAQIDSFDELNFNCPLSGASVYRGAVVRFAGSGINLQDANANVNLTPAGNIAYGSYMSFFGAPTGGLLKATTSGETLYAIGVTVYDQLTYDEYQTYLLYNQYRADQIRAVITGQSMPLIQEGIVLYSGIEGTPAGGSGVQVADAIDGGIKVVGPAVTPTLGKFLGPKDANGFALVQFNLLK